MNLNDCEAKKVFNFILENKSIGLDGLSIFNRDVLMVIWEIISGKSSKAFSLTEIKKNYLLILLLNILLFLVLILQLVF